MRLKVVLKPNGRRFVYYRAPGGGLHRLPDLPEDDPRFLAAYARLAAETSPATKAPKAGSLEALADRYLASAAFREMKPISQRGRAGVIKAILAKGGHVQVTALQRKHIQADLDKVSPGAAANRLKAWRALMRQAIRDDLRADDPSATVDLPRHRTTSYPRWTADDIAAFTARWPVGTPQRTAFELLYWTGCRRSDVVRLGWQHVRDGWLLWRQEKTGELAEVPIAARLAEALAHAPRDRLTFLETAQGASRSPNAFGNWFRVACDAACVDKSAHGLRHDFGSSAAEAGLTNANIGPMLGHRSLSEADTYTRAVERRRMVAEGMARLEGERRLETAKIEKWKPKS